ncbi:MAG: hypothetical protein ACRCYX_08530 [Dermatophilaceae bacterium]
MSTRHDDGPVEHDPTGIREILARLPEPEPMPHDLVARISAALVDDACGLSDRSAQGTTTSSDLVVVSARRAVSGPDGDIPAPVVVRRRSPRWLALGAAAVMVVGISGLVVSTLSGEIEASIGMSDDPTGSTGRSEHLAPRVDAGERTGAERADVHVIATGTSYASIDLVGQARTIAELSVERLAVRSAPELIADAGTLATPDGARACAWALGPEPWVTIIVDIATVDGAPAAVVVLTDSAGRTVIYAVARSCMAGAPGVVRGPLPLG